jgi:hypothetical protein
LLLLLLLLFFVLAVPCNIFFNMHANSKSITSWQNSEQRGITCTHCTIQSYHTWPAEHLFSAALQTTNGLPEYKPIRY